jgi:hypothetical protein
MNIFASACLYFPQYIVLIVSVLKFHLSFHSDNSWRCWRQDPDLAIMLDIHVIHASAVKHKYEFTDTFYSDVFSI